MGRDSPLVSRLTSPPAGIPKRSLIEKNPHQRNFPRWPLFLTPETVMDPLSPNDPLWKLLGKARQVEARPNFTQNVLRAARQTPQERGWLAALRAWWSEGEKAPGGLVWAAAAAVALAALVVFVPQEKSTPELAETTPVTVEPLLLESDFPLIEGYETEWENLEQIGTLLAVQDTSVLTDREINLLLY